MVAGRDGKPVEPSECSKVAKMMLAHALSKELVQVGSRPGLRDNIFNELTKSDGHLRSHEGLRNCASDLGRLLIDLPPDGTARPQLPTHLLDIPRDDFDLATFQPSASSNRRRQRLEERSPTPFRFSDTVTTPEAAKPSEFGDRGGHRNSKWPSPAVGRTMKIPGPPSARPVGTPCCDERAPPSRRGSSGGLSVSQSVPALNLAPKNTRLAEVLAKMKKTKADPGWHLRQFPINNAFPDQLTSTYMSASTGPVEMAMDPKWSTELKADGIRVMKKLKFNARLSAAGTTVSPELRYIPRDFEDGFQHKALTKGSYP